MLFFFFSSRRRHTRSLRDWSSDVCSSDLTLLSSVDGFGRPLFTNNPNTDNVVGQLLGAPVYRTRRALKASTTVGDDVRSEERRVGKECRSGWAAYSENKKKDTM